MARVINQLTTPLRLIWLHLYTVQTELQMGPWSPTLRTTVLTYHLSGRKPQIIIAQEADLQGACGSSFASHGTL